MPWQVGPLHRDSVGGIPTVWAESPGRFEAGLVFRVGTCDETLPRRGITHLVEHVAHPPHPTPGYDCNAWVAPAFTVFWAAGREARVLEHLATVCRSLADLPVDDLERERAVLLTEESQQRGSAEGTALGLRYGTLGHGASGFRELGLRWLGADDATAWARERFTLGNAALFMTGPPPDGLVLALPPGDHMQAPEPVGVDGLRFPCAHDDGPDELVAISLVGPDAEELTLGMRVAEHRATRRLRYGLGLSYSIETALTTLTPDLAHATIVADCLEGAEDAVAAQLVAVVRELVSEGPTDEEVAEATEELDRWTQEPERLPGELLERATDALLGRAHRGPLTPAVTPDAVARTLGRAFEASGLLVLPAGAEPPEGLARYGSASARPELGGDSRTFRPRRWWNQARELVIGEDGIDQIADDGTAGALRFSDCVAVVHGDGGFRTLVGRDARLILLDPDAWRRGGEAVRLVDAAVPAERHVPLRPARRRHARPRQARRAPPPRVTETPGDPERVRFIAPFGVEGAPRSAGAATIAWMGAILAFTSPFADGESSVLKVTDRRLLIATTVSGRIITSIPLAEVLDVTVTRHPMMTRSVVTVRFRGRSLQLPLSQADSARCVEAIRAGMAPADGGPPTPCP